MLIFDAMTNGRPSARFAVFGSCRVRNPLMDVAKANLVTSRFGESRGLTHSAPEALQMLRAYRGEISIPDWLAPLAFERDRSPRPTPEIEALLKSVDVFLVEVCESKYIRYHDYFLQQNYFARNFIKRNSQALMPWYRNFGQGRPVNDELVESTIAALGASGTPADDDMKDILRHAHIEASNGKSVLEAMRSLVEMYPRPWIFMSHFTIPGDDGAIMRDRRQLASDVESAARAVGARFFDPTWFIEQFGRENVLDANGADIFEYAAPFQETVSRKVLSLVDQTVRATPAFRAREAAEARNAEVERIATSLNESMIGFFRERMERMGVDESGLYNHYKTWLERRDLVSPSVETAKFILERVPNTAKIVVLKAGLGQLGFLLAEAGHPVTICEQTESRYRAIKDFEAFLTSDRGSEPGKRYHAEVVHGWFPGKESAGGLAVAEHFTGAAEPGQEEKVASRFAAFDQVIVRPRTFLNIRETPQTQSDGLALLQNIGFGKITKIPQSELVLLERGKALETA